MTLEQQIESFFQTNFKFYSITDLQKKFCLLPKEETVLQTILLNLESQGKIYYENGQYIHVSKDSYLKFGLLQKSNRNHYYIKTFEKEIILISKEDVLKMGTNINDKVFVEIVPKKEEHSKVRIRGVIKRVVQEEALKRQTFIRTKIEMDKDHQYYVIVQDKKFYLKPEFLNGAFAGDEVSLLMSEENSYHSFYVVEVIHAKQKNRIFEKRKGNWVSLENNFYKAVLDEKDVFLDGTKILATYRYNKKTESFHITCLKVVAENLEDWIIEYASQYGFSRQFSKESLAECSSLKKVQLDKDRVDLRKLKVISIDPESAKDLDDAISIEKKPSGYRLYVHIADVDFFIPLGSSLFQEAVFRGTSCYLGNVVIPQLPEILSNHLCSLNENEDELAKTMMIDVDYNGEILDFQIFSSLIRNKKQMTYDKVDLFLEHGILEKDYQNYKNMLLEMNELSSILQTKRIKRGYLPINVPEMKIVLDKDCAVSKLLEEKNGLAHRMIENFMLLANEATTDYCYWLNLPFVYRNHDSPSLSKLFHLKDTMTKLQYKSRCVKELRDQKKYQQYLTTVCCGCTKEEQKYIMTLFLQSLEKAYYGSINEGHFGLALKRYGTVTSPIRRGSDLINHAVISEFLKHGVTSEKLESLREFIVQNVEHLNQQEIASENLEKDIKKYLLEEYMYQFLDETFDATIEFVTETQIFIRTDNNILGVLPIEKPDIVDHIHHTYISNNKIYAVKDKIRVRLISTALSKDTFCLFSKENNLNLTRKL